MLRPQKILFLFVCIISILISCVKREGELHEIDLNKPFYPNLTFEAIDSITFPNTMDFEYFLPSKIPYTGTSGLTFLHVEKKLYAIDIHEAKIKFVIPTSSFFRSSLAVYDLGGDIIAGDGNWLQKVSLVDNGLLERYEMDQYLPPNRTVGAWTVVQGKGYFQVSTGLAGSVTIEVYEFDFETLNIKLLCTLNGGSRNVGSQEDRYILPYDPDLDQFIIPYNFASEIVPGLYVITVGRTSGSCNTILISTNPNDRNIFHYFVDYKDGVLYFNSSNILGYSLKEDRIVWQNKGFNFRIGGDYILTWVGNDGFRAYDTNNYSNIFSNLGVFHSGDFDIHPLVHPEMAIACNAFRRQLNIIDLQTGQLLFQNDLVPNEVMAGMFFDADSNTLCIINETGILRIYKWPF